MSEHNAMYYYGSGGNLTEYFTEKLPTPTDIIYDENDTGYTSAYGLWNGRDGIVKVGDNWYVATNLYATDSTTYIYKSSDFINWTNTNFAGGYEFVQIMAGTDKLYVVGNLESDGSVMIYGEYDGSDWVTEELPSFSNFFYDFGAIIDENDVVYVVGEYSIYSPRSYHILYNHRDKITGWGAWSEVSGLPSGALFFEGLCLDSNGVLNILFDYKNITWKIGNIITGDTTELAIANSDSTDIGRPYQRNGVDLYTLWSASGELVLLKRNPDTLWSGSTILSDSDYAGDVYYLDLKIVNGIFHIVFTTQLDYETYFVYYANSDGITSYADSLVLIYLTTTNAIPVPRICVNDSDMAIILDDYNTRYFINGYLKTGAGWQRVRKFQNRNNEMWNISKTTKYLESETWNRVNI